MGMGILGFIRKMAGITKEPPKPTIEKKKLKITFTETINGETIPLTDEPAENDDERFSPDLEHLTQKGNLPWGWCTHNKNFIDQIQCDYSYFLNMWLDSRSKSPREHSWALKSFVVYLEDVEKLCKTKGECFEFWFYEILITRDYIAKRKSELDELTSNLKELQAAFVKRNKELPDLDERIIKMLIEHPNVLQSDFVKMFDPVVKNDVTEKLYFMEKSGQLERTKSGRSYILHYKE